jgi:hypothetical protein
MPAPIPTWDGVGFAPSLALPTARTGEIDDDPPPPPPVETLTVSEATYSPTRGWRLSGRLTGSTSSSPRVRAKVGSTLSGALIGSASVASDGSWQIRVSSGPAPSSTNTVSFESNGSATLLAVPITRVP